MKTVRKFAKKLMNLKEIRQGHTDEVDGKSSAAPKKLFCGWEQLGKLCLVGH